MPEEIVEKGGSVSCSGPMLLGLPQPISSPNVIVSYHLAVNFTKLGPRSRHLVVSTELVLKMLLSE